MCKSFRILFSYLVYAPSDIERFEISTRFFVQINIMDVFNESLEELSYLFVTLFVFVFLLLFLQKCVRSVVNHTKG